MKRLVVALLVSMLFSSLFALGQQEEPKRKTIVWWHSNSGLLAEATDRMVQEYNQGIGKEKGITVQAVYQGKASDALTKVKAIWQGGNTKDLPDIIQLDAQAIMDIRDNPTLIPMEKVATGNGYDLSQIVASTRLSQTYKNVMIGMPFNSSTILLYYNKTAFDEAGITEAPRTLDEMTKDASLLWEKDKNGKTIRWGFSGVPTTYELCAWLGQQHGLSPITDQNNGHDGIPTKVLFDENGTMKAFLTKWQALYDTGALENATSGTTASFASGKTAMTLKSTSQLTTMIEMTQGKFELGVAPLPMVDEDATGGVNIGGGALYLLDNKTGQENEAWSFVQFAVSKEQQLAWHVATGYFPVNEGTYDMDDFKRHQQEHPLFQTAITQMRESNPALQGIWVPSSYEIYYAFQTGIQKMLTEHLSIDDAVASMAKEINGYFTRYRTTQE